MHRSTATHVLAALLVLAACGGDDEASRDSVRAAAATPVPRPPSDPNCPRDGRWHPCGLEDRMIKAGLGFRSSGDTVRIRALNVPGAVYRIGKVTQFVAFFYPDSAARKSDVGALDMNRFITPGDSSNPWPTRPVVLQSANLLAVLVDASETQSERIGLALAAGAPQPAPPDTGAKASSTRLDSVVVR